MKPTNLKPLRSTIVVLRRFFCVILTIGRTVLRQRALEGSRSLPGAWRHHQP